MKIEETMKQAPMTIDFYFTKAISSIDEKFGEGFAKKNPDLVAQYIQACIKDFTVVRMEALGDDVVHALNSLSESIDSFAGKE